MHPTRTVLDLAHDLHVPVGVVVPHLARQGGGRQEGGRVDGLQERSAVRRDPDGGRLADAGDDEGGGVVLKSHGHQFVVGVVGGLMLAGDHRFFKNVVFTLLRI